MKLEIVTINMDGTTTHHVFPDVKTFHFAHEEPEPKWMEDVKYHLAKGTKVMAIKAYRAETGLGLKESKQFIDDLAPDP